MNLVTILLAVSVVLPGVAAYALARRWGDREWWRAPSLVPAIITGAALAVASIVVVVLTPFSWHRTGFATLLAGIAAEYTGFALIDRRLSRMVVEGGWAAFTVAAAVAGVALAPAWLALGFIGHIGWDLMHHDRIKRIDTVAVPGWYASACLVYDLPLGFAALLFS